MTHAPEVGTATISPADSSAVQIVNPAPTVAAPAPNAAASPAAPAVIDVPQPALGSALGRLRSRGDGTHELTVALHPADLGSVGVTATVRDGAITVSVACAQDGAHAAVDAALPSLRHELAQAGFTAIDVTVSGNGNGRDGAAHTPNRDLAPPAGQRPGDDVGAEPERPVRRLVRSTALDRLL